jgi:hypothetical protein
MNTQQNTDRDSVESTALFANFVRTGNEYKTLAKTIRHEDGDRAWIRLDELKRQWVDASWLLHEHLPNTLITDTQRKQTDHK